MSGNLPAVDDSSTVRDILDIALTKSGCPESLTSNVKSALNGVDAADFGWLMADPDLPMTEEIRFIPDIRNYQVGCLRRISSCPETSGEG